MTEFSKMFRIIFSEICASLWWLPGDTSVHLLIKKQVNSSVESRDLLHNTCPLAWVKIKVPLYSPALWEPGYKWHNDILNPKQVTWYLIKVNDTGSCTRSSRWSLTCKQWWHFFLRRYQNQPDMTSHP